MTQYLFLSLSICLASACGGPKNTPQPIGGELAQPSVQTVNFRLDTVASGLKTCFGMDWLPDGRALITERGRATDWLSVMDMQTGSKTAICNLPKAHRKGQGGALDVLVHPDYATNGWIYFSYSTPRGNDMNTMVVDRAKLTNGCLTDRQPIFEVFPAHDESFHYGNRLAIKDGYLYLCMGERFFARDSAQSLTNHFGKTFRLHDDGRIPTDNPFRDTPGARTEIYSYGHRNPQGLAFRPSTDQLWASEHGPQGGDEVNWIRAGANYGWPIITYGENYGGGKIGDGITHMQGMEQPVHHYVPSIAPGGMTWYTGDVFPEWRGNLFIGALAKAHLNRLMFEGDKVVREERLLDGAGHQIRLVKQGPDGCIYFSTNDGLLVRVRRG